jgi:hypothetical protein
MQVRADMPTRIVISGRTRLWDVRITKITQTRSRHDLRGIGGTAWLAHPASAAALNKADQSQARVDGSLWPQRGSPAYLPSIRNPSCKLKQ